MTETRRLAAITAIDVVGYSRLMGEDEEGTARAVREHREAARPLVTGRGGRVVKAMGDGLLLEFPSVVDAVECAIAIQSLMVERNAGAPEGESGVAPDHERASHPREIGREVLRDPVDEMLLLLAAAEIGEWQDDDREARRALSAGRGGQGAGALRSAPVLTE